MIDAKLKFVLIHEIGEFIIAFFNNLIIVNDTICLRPHSGIGTRLGQ